MKYFRKLPHKITGALAGVLLLAGAGGGITFATVSTAHATAKPATVCYDCTIKNGSTHCKICIPG